LGAVWAAVVAWLTFFFDGAIPIVGGCLEDRLGYWIERDPEYGFRIALNERTKCCG